MNKEYKCEHCGKEMSKQDYYELNGLCIDCWEDRYKQEEDLYRYKNRDWFLFPKTCEATIK